MGQENTEALAMFQGSSEDLEDTLTRFAELKREIKRLEDLKKEYSRMAEMLGQVFMERNIQSHKRGDGQFILTTDRRFKVEPEDRETQRTWCEENDHREALTVNHQTWQGMMRERVEDGLEVPEFTTFTETKKVTIRGLK